MVGPPGFLRSRPSLAIVAALLVLPASLIGDESARAFRNFFNWGIGHNDWLFDLIARSYKGAALAVAVEAWLAWTILGLVSGLIAMAAAQALVWRRGGGAEAAAVVTVWAAIRLLIWNWDGVLQFRLSEFRLGGPPVQYGAWPIAPWAGALLGLGLGLLCAVIRLPPRRPYP